MKEMQLSALLNPAIAGVFAIAFFALWSKQRDSKHILAMGIAYTMCSAGVIISTFLLPVASAVGVAISGAVYTAGTATIMWAVAHRAGKQPALFSMLIGGTIGVSVALFLLSVMPGMMTRSLVLNSTVGLLFATGVWNMRETRANGGPDQLLFWVFMGITGQFLLLPSVLIMLGAHTTAETYRETLYWLILNFALAVSSVVLALSLLAACASDLLEQVRELANIDKLTGIKNRRAFEDAIDSVFAKVDRVPTPISVVVADLDHFKQINDKHGHQAGDKVLQAFGHLLRRCTRDSDLVGRIGGEEFCIVLWNTGAEGARLFAEALRASFDALYVSGCLDSSSLTASFGVVERKDKESFEVLYSAADQAMYEAKANGRNCVVVADSHRFVQSQRDAA